MKSLWDQIDRFDLSVKAKLRIAFLFQGIIYAIGGFLAWSLISHWAFASTDWLICFVGYPVIASFFITAVYSCLHKFSEGSFACLETKKASTFIS